MYAALWLEGPRGGGGLVHREPGWSQDLAPHPLAFGCSRALTMNNVRGPWSSGTPGPQPGPLPGTSVTLAFPVSEKEGECPDTVVEAANCTEECQTDSDCEENLKCCQTGCGWSCQIPNGNAPP